MKRKYSTYRLYGYDDDYPSSLFAGWQTVKKFKALHISHAKTLGKKFARKLNWSIWRVKKEPE